MEIKIDTKKDSVDDIKKMIEFLHRFIGESSSLNPYSKPDDVPSASELPGGAFNMFNDPPSSSSDNSSSTFTPPSTPDDDSDELPQIEPY